MMDEERKRQLVNLLRTPVFDIHSSDDVALNRYDQALTHSTYAKEQRDRGNRCDDNELLEFFGNYVLDFLIVSELYERIEDLKRQYPGKKDEALLTDMLHEITNDKQLSEKAISIDSFNEAIQCGKGQKLNVTIRAGAFEAFIAAVYDDLGTDQTRTIVNRLFRDEINNAAPIVSWKNKLQECVQKQKRVPQVKEIIRYDNDRIAGTPDDNPSHISKVCIKTKEKWELWGTGEGKQIEDAEVEAARDAYEKHCGQGQKEKTPAIPCSKQ
jgi:dsRNA-specific ribonuclease